MLKVFESINCVCRHNVNQLILATKAVHTNTRGVDDGDYKLYAPMVCLNNVNDKVAFLPCYQTNDKRC